MRKILVSLALVAAMAAPSLANVYLDAYGLFLTSGDAEYQYGGGAGLGIDFLPDAGFVWRGMYGFSSFDADTKKEETYGFMMQLFGVEYTYQVPQAYMGWKSSVMIGISELSKEYKEYDTMSMDYKSRDKREIGMTVGIWTGVIFYVSQHVAPFIDVGYHYSSFSGYFKNDLIHGAHIMLGVRFTLWQKNRSIYNQY